jgi:hypothetical protein
MPFDYVLREVVLGAHPGTTGIQFLHEELNGIMPLVKAAEVAPDPGFGEQEDWFPRPGLAQTWPGHTWCVRETDTQGKPVPQPGAHVCPRT